MFALLVTVSCIQKDGRKLQDVHIIIHYLDLVVFDLQLVYSV